MSDLLSLTRVLFYSLYAAVNQCCSLEMSLWVCGGTNDALFIYCKLIGQGRFHQPTSFTIHTCTMAKLWICVDGKSLYYIHYIHVALCWIKLVICICL